ncbi:protein low psii accumulation 1 chloroplastic [Phtheirospermum japonicum]|uniref:Protein low psii accumulation 1 chloroplastic n=1 Tax=Phtheirospermum japonicum TaxID=374723 RepID=A0A830DI21_9LAMI|nr:protein low psii accumulation 1 chloroplastic [Phtheirospermum japonicum]
MATFAPPRHRSPPNLPSLRTSKTCFLSGNLARQSLFWAPIGLTITTNGPLMNCSPSSTSPEVSAPTAEACINLGLSLFAKGRVRDALQQFDTALTLDPNPVEAQAALYNKACCHAYREEGKKVADCLRTALKDYGLKFGTILNDPDLAAFRATPEFRELQEELLLGFLCYLPIPRLLLAVKGGDSAPDLLDTSGNAGINIGGIIVLVALFFWENKKEEEQLAQITRNETLSRLPLRLSN